MSSRQTTSPPFFLQAKRTQQRRAETYVLFFFADRPGSLPTGADVVSLSFFSPSINAWWATSPVQRPIGLLLFPRESMLFTPYRPSKAPFPFLPLFSSFGKNAEATNP